MVFDSIVSSDPSPAAALLNLGKAFQDTAKVPYITKYLAGASCGAWASANVRGSYVDIESRYNTRAARPGTNGGLVPLGTATPLVPPVSAANTFNLAACFAIFVCGLFVQLLL